MEERNGASPPVQQDGNLSRRGIEAGQPPFGGSKASAGIISAPGPRITRLIALCKQPAIVTYDTPERDGGFYGMSGNCLVLQLQTKILRHVISVTVADLAQTMTTGSSQRAKWTVHNNG